MTASTTATKVSNFTIRSACSSSCWHHVLGRCGRLSNVHLKVMDGAWLPTHSKPRPVREVLQQRGTARLAYVRRARLPTHAGRRLVCSAFRHCLLVAGGQHHQGQLRLQRLLPACHPRAAGWALRFQSAGPIRPCGRGACSASVVEAAGVPTARHGEGKASRAALVGLWSAVHEIHQDYCGSCV